MLLDSAQIAAMRVVAEQALPDVCTIRRSTDTSDAGGGTTQTWADQATLVPCRVSPIGGGERGMTGSRISDESTHVITLAAKTDVLEADRIVVEGVVYEITLVRKRGAWELTRRCECTEAP